MSVVDVELWRDRAEGVMRRDGDVIGFGHRRDFFELADAAAVTDVGLNDCGSALLQDLTEGKTSEQPLASCDRDRQRSRYLRHGVHVLWRTRLLEEPRPKWCKREAVLDRHCRRCSSV